jgi:hypothetical protein
MTTGLLFEEIEFIPSSGYVMKGAPLYERQSVRNAHAVSLFDMLYMFVTIEFIKLFTNCPTNHWPDQSSRTAIMLGGSHTVQTIRP